MAGRNDPLNFCRAEDYFDAAKVWGGPKEVISASPAPPAPRDPTVSSQFHDTHYHGLTLRFDDGTLCVVQFIRPTVFRLRYDPSVNSPNDYGDENSQTILGNFTSELIHYLDDVNNIQWSTSAVRVECEESAPKAGYWRFTSNVTEAGYPRTQCDENRVYEVGDGMALIIHQKPFKIQTIRRVKPLSNGAEFQSVPELESAYKTIWETSSKALRWNIHPDHSMLRNVVLEVLKPGYAEYLGFGLQGGTEFMKRTTYMNYFSELYLPSLPVNLFNSNVSIYFDNMKYQQVYKEGALDPREPLYHSDPFYMEVNGNPEHSNVTAAFVDNYSQIALDLGKTDPNHIRLGTRFNAMDVYILSANSLSDILRLQTNILGRGKLKPRYVLGHHQACYGYSTATELYQVANTYRALGIPLDSIHVDVDFQDRFRTFTMNPENDPKRMFSTLREKGIKCSANITPAISNRDPYPGSYSTLQEGLAERYTQGTSGKAQDVRYLNFSSGHADEIDPKDMGRRPDYGDDYDFVEDFNSQMPYHGAVSYGYFSGAPSYYVDMSTESNQRWWGQQYQELFDLGVEFIWQDMTTPSNSEAYGDMKGFPSRLWLNSNAVKMRHKKQLAIEIWALYSYNLHKATYEGLCRLKGREDKRNFVLGRGSFTGMFRYAGLWSGDNSSTWDFWRITIPQVLSMGLSGFAIFGTDTGGFEPATSSTESGDEEHYCSPELLIRWYAGSFLLPWLRNHYVRKGRKWFQEPYNYSRHYWQDLSIPKEQYYLYMAVERIIKYYVELRYSLMQLLYDAMFESSITGLPIARSMLLTDPQDPSLSNQSKEFLANQYICGQDMLVAPVMYSSAERPGNNRDVYLPQGFFWYHSNLRPWNDQVVALGSPVEGGTVINYTAKITNNYADFPCVTPVYIREGSIIPQLQVRQYVDDYRDGPNHLKFNIYPGKYGEHHTYLDDGVSRSSAPLGPQPRPKNGQPLARSAQNTRGLSQLEVGGAGYDIFGCDRRANGEFRKISSKSVRGQSVRTIRIVQEHDNYNPQREVGGSYTLVVFYGEGEVVDVSKIQVDIEPKGSGRRGASGNTATLKSEKELRAVVITVHETFGATKELTVKLTRNEQRVPHG